LAGTITPWKRETPVPFRQSASALTAGCTVVMKPSELSALQTQVWIECVHEAKLPKGLVQRRTGRGDVVGAELVRNSSRGQDLVTGSVAVGKSIMRDGAATMKRVTLELGGKSPNILLDDADLKKAIPTRFVTDSDNSGQACAAGARSSYRRALLDEVKRAIVDNHCPPFPLVIGRSKDAVGPMVNEKQYERVQFIHSQRDRRGQKCWSAARHPRGLDAGYFVNPTVLST